jgi:hypothetical protein
VHRGPPTSHFAQRRFRPVSGPTTSPAVTTYRARAPGRWQGAPLTASPGPAMTSPRHPLPLLLWLTPAPKRGAAPVMGAVATRPATSRCIHAVHVPRATAAISSRRHHPWLSPTLAARGNPVPCSLTRRRRRRRRGGGGGTRSCAACREAGAAREEEPNPREPRAPATSASWTSSPPRRPASPTSAASLLVTAPRTLHRCLHIGQRPPR